MSLMDEFYKRAERLEDRSRDEFAEIGRRGSLHARALLVAKGVRPPRDVAHADSFDPPLMLAEQRHELAHVRQEQPQPALCRFCREEGT